MRAVRAYFDRHRFAPASSDAAVIAGEWWNAAAPVSAATHIPPTTRLAETSQAEDVAGRPQPAWPLAIGAAGQRISRFGRQLPRRGALRRVSFPGRRCRRRPACPGERSESAGTAAGSVDPAPDSHETLLPLGCGVAGSAAMLPPPPRPRLLVGMTLWRPGARKIQPRHSNRKAVTESHHKRQGLTKTNRLRN